MTFRRRGHWHFDKVTADIIEAAGSAVSGGASGGGADYGEGAPPGGGNHWYVDSGATAAGTGKSWSQALLTIDAAVNKATASNGDVIHVREGHAESITGAAGIDADVIGITIVGHGEGSNRPTVTFTTAAAADVDIDAANVSIRNILFVNDIDSQTAMIDVNATDFELINCEFRSGSAKQALIYVDLDGGANGCDGAKLYGNRFESTAAGAASAIKLTEVQDRVEIVGNRIYGDFSDAGIHNPAGKVCTELLIANNIVRNTQTGDHAIELVSACTGECVDNVLFADAAATVLDPGSLHCAGNWAQMAVDLPGFMVPLTEEDQVTSAIGVNDANNAYDSSSVAANEDGSVLERLEQIQEATNKGAGTAIAAGKSLADALGSDGTTVTDSAVSVLGAIGYNDANNAFSSATVAANEDGSVLERLEQLQEAINKGTGTALASNTSVVDLVLGSGSSGQNSRLGTQVTRAGTDLLDGTKTAVFTVSTGRVLVTALIGEITTAAADAAACTIYFEANPTTGTTNAMSALTADCNADEIGTMYSLSGTVGDALLEGKSGSVPGMTTNGVVVNAGTIDFSGGTTDVGTGGALLDLELWYFPIDAGATVASA